MDSFHAHRVVAQHPLPIVHNNVYPMLFKVAFQDRRHQALQDLVATWPHQDLHFLQLVEHQELVLDRNNMVCIEAIIQAVVKQLQRELEEPGSDSSRRQLCELDMTGVRDDPNRLKFSLTKALSKACLEVSRHQQELQRHRSKRRKGCSGATTAAPQLQGVVIRVDLRVNSSSLTILRKVLQTRATGLLHIKCRDFQAENISATQIVTLLESLDPSCLWRVHLWSDSFEWKDLSEIMPHLSRFPELHSLVIRLDKIDLRSMTPGLAMRIRGMAAQLGMLRGLRELSLGMIELSGNLHRFLCDLQAPLESLDLGSCCLVPADLAFLSQSFHTPALKRLVLNGNNISQGLLEPLQRLLEKASASLLLLDLSYCHIADSHLAVLLPTLLRCSHLRFLGLYGNPLSMAALKNLLQKTLGLGDLTHVEYPHPVDCSRPEDFTWHCLTYEERLATAKKVFSQILANSGRTDVVWNSSLFVDTGPDYFFL